MGKKIPPSDMKNVQKILQFNLSTLGRLRTTCPLSKVVEMTPSSTKGSSLKLYKDFNLTRPKAPPLMS